MPGVVTYIEETHEQMTESDLIGKKKEYLHETK